MAFEQEKRTEERFPANANTTCGLAAPIVEELGAVRVKNISLKGVGLLVSKQVAPGTLLVIKLVNPLKKITKTALVRIIHSAPQAGGSFLVGGDWDTPLTYEELCHFVM